MMTRDNANRLATILAQNGGLLVNMGAVLAPAYEKRYAEVYTKLVGDGVSREKARDRAHTLVRGELVGVPEASIRTEFDAPLLPRANQPSVKERPMPIMIKATVVVPFADDLLEQKDDAMPFIACAKAQEEASLAMYGRPGTVTDCGLRKWEPAFYDLIVAHIKAKKTRREQAEKDIAAERAAASKGQSATA